MNRRRRNTGSSTGSGRINRSRATQTTFALRRSARIAENARRRQMEEYERQRDAHELAIYNSNPERFNENDLRNTRSRSTIARIRGGGVAVRRATSITRLNRQRIHRNRVMTNADRVINTSYVPSSIFNSGMTFAFDLNLGHRVHDPSIEVSPVW